MEYDFLANNPLLSDLSPEKLEFLMHFAGSQKPTEMKDMMPFLLASMNRAKSQNIQFTDVERDLLIEILKQNMTPEEAGKADKIIKLMKERRSG